MISTSMVSTPQSDSAGPRPPYPEYPSPDENPREFQKRRLEWVMNHFLPHMSTEEIAAYIIQCWDSNNYMHEAIQHRNKKIAEINMIISGNWSK